MSLWKSSNMYYCKCAPFNCRFFGWLVWLIFFITNSNMLKKTKTNMMIIYVTEVIRLKEFGSIFPISYHCVMKLLVIKSPQYTGGDFMFLYLFVRRRRRRRRSRRRRPQILVHAITFEQLFGFLSFLAQLLALTCRLPDYILVDFRRDLDLDFSRSNMEFAISQPKMVRLPRNEKQTYRLNSRAQMWPSGLTLAMTLT